MPVYKVIGVKPWRRIEGQLVAPGDTFEATVREQQRIKRRGYWDRLERVEKNAPPAPSKSAALPQVAEQQVASKPDVPSTEDMVELLADWPLRMEPRRYLKLHPTGGHAVAAQRIVDLEDAREETP